MAMTIEEMQAILDAEALGQRNEAEAPEKADEPSDGKLRLKKTIPATAPGTQPELPLAAVRSPTSAAPRREPSAFRSAMSLMTMLIVLGGICYLGWRFLHRASDEEPVEEVEVRVATVTPRPVKRTRPAYSTRDATYTTLEATCPTCLGKGNHKIPGAKLASSVYGCPVCSSRGTRTLEIPKGQSLCADCRGMGRKGVLDDFFATKRRYKSESCKSCRGNGHK